jgi:YVTN family beta-propeller protein
LPQNQILFPMNYISFLNLLIISLLILTGCKPEQPASPTEAYSTGIFISNEGIYGQTSGTISHYNPDSGIVTQKIFKTKNGRDLGNVVQSMTFVNDKAYIVVNNSNKIEVADANNFEEYAQITNLLQPRYMLAIDTNTAYVSQWGLDLLSGSVAVIDLHSHQILQTIVSGIGKGPERMCLHNGKVYVANVGGLESDNFISVIDINSHSVVDTIIVDDNPNSLQLGSDGLLWVACGGKTVYANYPEIDTAASTYGAVVAISPNTGGMVHRIALQKGRGAHQLTKDNTGNSLFFSYNNQVCKLNTAQAQWQSLFAGNFYGLGYNPTDNYIYAAENAGIQAAWAYRYRATDGTLVDSFRVGIFANGFWLK